MELDSDGTTAMFQDIATRPGFTYRLSFALKARGYNWWSNRRRVTWGGADVVSLTPNAAGWHYYECQVVASGSSTRLQFPDYPDADTVGTLIDDVRLAVLSGPATVDIKPGDTPNSVNLKSKGLLPVAILGADWFDVRTVKPETTMIGSVDLPENGSYDNRRLMYGYEDVNGDGYEDLVGQFVVWELVKKGALTAECTSLTVTAQLSDGSEIVGQDTVAVTPSSAT